MKRNQFGILILVLLTLLGCSKSKQDKSKSQADSLGVITLQLFQEDGLYGYRDADGTVTIKPKYIDAGEFSEGLARVKTDAADLWGYIDTRGEMMIAPEYEGASDFIDSKAVVLSKEKFIYISPDGLPLGFVEDDEPYKPLSAGDFLYALHPNGLIARSLGSSSAEAVGEVPFGEQVEYVYDPNQRQFESLDGLFGSWLAVRFQGKRGYLFDVYLARFPQSELKRPVESYKVVVSSSNTDEYSTYTLTRYVSGGRLKTHEGQSWAESEEIVPNATVDQVIAREKLFPSGELGALVQEFTGESRSFTTDNGEDISITVRRDSQGYLESVLFTKKTEEVTVEVGIERHNIHHVAISMTSGS